MQILWGRPNCSWERASILWKHRVLTWTGCSIILVRYAAIFHLSPVVWDTLQIFNLPLIYASSVSLSHSYSSFFNLSVSFYLSLFINIEEIYELIFYIGTVCLYIKKKGYDRSDASVIFFGNYADRPTNQPTYRPTDGHKGF